jgi:putative membrane protein
MLMLKASEMINAEQRAQVESAVAAAELMTCCEIVPVVATASDPYHRAADLAGLWLAIVAAVAAFLLLPGDYERGTWGGFPLWIQAAALALVMLAGFIIGAVSADRFQNLRRLFTARSYMQTVVRRRARELFFDRRIHHTAAESGLLIFVSLHERTAVILGDRNVLKSLGENFIEDLCRRLTASLQTQDIASALCDTIQHAATSLRNALPRSASSVQELPDTLVLLD